MFTGDLGVAMPAVVTEPSQSAGYAYALIAKIRFAVKGLLLATKMAFTLQIFPTSDFE
ncbi:MAG: hypothetical protein V7K15_29495 [Nostoc sp.]